MPRSATQAAKPSDLGAEDASQITEGLQCSQKLSYKTTTNSHEQNHQRDGALH